MKITDIPFGTTDWSTIEPSMHKGETGFATTLGPGVSYQVADGAEPHRLRTKKGARLFIVD